MSIVNFFEKVAGTWFSQRTTHFSPGQPSQTGQSTLEITPLPEDDPRIAALCQAFGADPAQVAFAVTNQQEAKASLYGSDTATPKRTTVLVGLTPDPSEKGTFFSQTEQEPAVSGHYRLQEEVLTLMTQADAWQSEERIWFMNPNLRMRTSVLTRPDGFQMASFCSEIRRLSS